MKKMLSVIILTFLMIGTTCFSRRGESVPIETKEVNIIVEITALNPQLNMLPLSMINSFSIDELNNIYLLDMSGHRIMKYDSKGVFLLQIGSIGQTKECLFSPVGLSLGKDILYVLNEGGREIKMFTTNGEYMSSFRIEKAWTSYSICAIGDLIYVNVIKNKQPKEENRGLISVFSKDGRLVRTMGKIVKCNSLGGYFVFNKIILAAVDNRLYWAFKNIPLINSENLGNEDEGNILDLRKLGVPEMMARAEKAKMPGFDTPDTIKPETDLLTNSYIFCNAFGVDDKEQIFYVIQEYPDAPGQNGIKCHLLVIKKDGKSKKKIILQHDGLDIIVSHLLFGPGELRYGIGEIKGQILLFNF